MALATEDIEDTQRSAAPARPARSTRKSRRRVHKALLTTHVLSAVGWFGAAIMVAFTGIVGSANDELALYELIRTSLWLTVPLGSDRGGHRRGPVVDHALGPGPLLVGRAQGAGHGRGHRHRRAGRRAEMAHALDTRTVTALPGPVIAHCVVLALATVLSVVKPRPRTPFAR